MTRTENFYGIGTRISEIIAGSELSNYFVARELGVSENTLRNYEKNVSFPNAGFIYDFCKYFKIPYCYLLEGIDFSDDVFMAHYNSLSKKDKQEIDNLIYNFNDYDISILRDFNSLSPKNKRVVSNLIKGLN